MSPDARDPLGPVTSIKVKLGLLVAASVLVAAVLATLGAGAVPAWLSIPVRATSVCGAALGLAAIVRPTLRAASRLPRWT